MQREQDRIDSQEVMYVLRCSPRRRECEEGLSPNEHVCNAPPATSPKETRRGSVRLHSIIADYLVWTWTEEADERRKRTKAGHKRIQRSVEVSSRETSDDYRCPWGRKNQIIHSHEEGMENIKSGISSIEKIIVHLQQRLMSVLDGTTLNQKAIGTHLVSY